MNARLFRLEMEMHRDRVRELAMVVYDRLSALSFNEVKPSSDDQKTEKNHAKKFLRDYLALHDAPKMQSTTELRPHGYQNAASIAERLAVFYGRRADELSPERSLALKALIEELNQIENRQKREFFRRYEIGLDQQELFMRAELIADITDTGIARRDEMGLSRDPYNGFHFLMNRGDFAGAELSRWLEDNYGRILRTTSS